ncbi:hypothetical protein IS481_14730 [Caldimonas thermodepolymerans]|nr:hypothetical protein [Caldimonas thermodepolymerans]QPC30978.1 hypothetical protein IS481_14730 [Caldimonas thermodepolymerans]
MTDVSIALNGTERRVPLRAFPRRTYTSQFTFLDDQARAQRDVLRYADRVVFPLAMHQLPAEATAADAGVGAGSVYLSRRKNGTYVLVSAPRYEWPLSAAIYPCTEGRIAPSRTITHHSAGVSSAVMSFTVEDLDEAIAPWGGEVALDGKPVWPVRADWSTEASERVDDFFDSADFGHRTLREVRYSKRVISVSLLLIGRPAILDFRRLVFTLRGRCKPFRYTFEPDGFERVWRLNTDSVSIDYLRPSLARVELEFLEIEE